MTATATINTYENVTPTAPGIESKDYNIEAEELSNLVVIRAMTANLVFAAQDQGTTVEEIINEDQHSFTMAARKEANLRGINGTYIGAVTRALRLALNRMAEDTADMEAMANTIIAADNERQVEVNTVIGKFMRSENSAYWAREQSQLLGDKFKSFNSKALRDTDNIRIILSHAERLGFPQEHLVDTTSLVLAYRKRLVSVSG